MLLWFYVQELPKAQPAVVLVLKRLRRRGNGLKSHPTDWEKPGISQYNVLNFFCSTVLAVDNLCKYNLNQWHTASQNTEKNTNIKGGLLD